MNKLILNIDFLIWVLLLTLIVLAILTRHKIKKYLNRYKNIDAYLFKEDLSGKFYLLGALSGMATIYFLLFSWHGWQYWIISGFFGIVGVLFFCVGEIRRVHLEIHAANRLSYLPNLIFCFVGEKSKKELKLKNIGKGIAFRPAITTINNKKIEKPILVADSVNPDLKCESIYPSALEELKREWNSFKNSEKETDDEGMVATVQFNCINESYGLDQHTETKINFDLETVIIKNVSWHADYKR
ncbi:MAG: hypothetical protein HYT12_03565 [Candidatus Liptonbacteria bacterium]|nr:hypothetical protein [Candidatus Liptonbacteria bacterium]